MRWNAAIRSILTLACGVAYCGCGDAEQQCGKLPELIPAKGTVTFKGKPLTKGTVQFEPDGYGRPATGHIQPDGTFVLTTLKDGDGVVAGHHKVAVSGTGPTPAKEAIPKKYTQVGTSKLEVDVDAEHVDFPLVVQ
jgi:hypothetical protein